MNTLLSGYLLVVGSAAAFAALSLFTRLAYEVGSDPWAFIFVHSGLSLLPLGYMLLRERAARTAPLAPATDPAGRRWFLLFAVSGAGAAIGFNLALSYLSLSLGTILLFAFPAFVALESWALLGQRPGGMTIVALLMTLVGVVLTVNLRDAASGAVSPMGIALAVFAAASHGLYMTAGERLSADLSPMAATAITRLVILGGVVLLHPRVLLELGALPWQGWVIGAVSAALGGVVPFLFLYKGIALLGATRAAIASAAELPIALGLGLLFQGDLILPLQWAGAALIGGAMLVSQSREA